MRAARSANLVGVVLVVALPLAAGCRTNGSAAAIPDAATGHPDAATGSPDAGALLTPPVNTVPFVGGVYFVGQWPGVEPGLQRFWPTRATNYYAGFEDSPDFFAFRPTDNQLFYSYYPYGIRIDDSATGPDTRVATPPCVPVDANGMLNDSVNAPFGFDGQGTLYYMCGVDLRRGNGELVQTPSALIGVLADGRAVVLIEDANNDPNTIGFAAIARDGTVLSDLRLTAPPGYQVLTDSVTVQGNDAFVLLSRTAYHSDMTPYIAEFVGYRLDPQSRWLFVRSVPVDLYGLWTQIMISDGTILMYDLEVETAGSFARVTAFPPDGTKRVAWRQADSPGVWTTIPKLIVGPAEPSGPSVYPE